MAFKNSRIKDTVLSSESKEEYVTKAIELRLATSEGEAKKQWRKFKNVTVMKKDETLE